MEQGHTALSDFKNDLSEWLSEISFFLECRIDTKTVAECREALNDSLQKYHLVAVGKHHLPPSLFNAIIGFSRLSDISERIEEGWLQNIDEETAWTMNSLVYAGMELGSSFREMGEEIKITTRPYVSKALKFINGPKRHRDRGTPLDVILLDAFRLLSKEYNRHPTFDELINSLRDNKHSKVIQEIDDDLKIVCWVWENNDQRQEKDTTFKTVRNKLTLLKKKPNKKMN